ncbi:phosphatase PAP2 family protein [Micromonospora sp. NBC_01412]|uniref:phosphatase PAP2 family protein n=1 Tax=Micromonospora sp. NBC_01412 TaxID=2903590 RepID=UPI0032494606
MLVVVMQAGSYPAVLVAAAAAVILRRTGIAWRLLLAGNLAYWLALAVKAAVARQRPAALLTDANLRDTITGALGYPSGHVAVATALSLVVARTGSPRWRRLAWVVIALVAVARIHVGAHLPVDAAGGILVGWLAVCLTRLAIGEVGPQQSARDLHEALRRRGFDVRRLEPIRGDARGSQPWQAVTTAGRRLFVKVTGGQQRDADCAYKLYRKLRYRHVADAPPYLSAKQQSEHETYLTLLAAQAGVRVPAVVSTATTPGGNALLVQEYVDAAALDAVVGPVPVAAVRDAWEQAALLHRAGIAHRLTGALVALLVLAAVLAVPRICRRGRAAAGQVITALRTLTRQHRLRRLVAASVALTLTYGLCLYLALLATGQPVDLTLLPPVILVCVIGEGVASAAPTPGGLGATEAALVSGLLLYGVQLDTAVAGVLIYRLATFWIPVPPGYLALRTMTRRRLL